MNVKIILSGPGGELDSVVLENINDETDDRISKAVVNMCDALTWAVGDILSIVEVDDRF